MAGKLTIIWFVSSKETHVSALKMYIGTTKVTTEAETTTLYSDLAYTLSCNYQLSADLFTEI